MEGGMEGGEGGEGGRGGGRRGREEGEGGEREILYMQLPEEATTQHSEIGQGTRDMMGNSSVCMCVGKLPM